MHISPQLHCLTASLHLVFLHPHTLSFATSAPLLLLWAQLCQESHHQWDSAGSLPVQVWIFSVSDLGGQRDGNLKSCS